MANIVFALIESSNPPTENETTHILVFRAAHLLGRLRFQVSSEGRARTQEIDDP